MADSAVGDFAVDERMWCGETETTNTKEAVLDGTISARRIANQQETRMVCIIISDIFLCFFDESIGVYVRVRLDLNCVALCCAVLCCAVLCCAVLCDIHIFMIDDDDG